MAEGPDRPKTTLGMDQNLEALIAYVLGWLTGIIILLLEKENEYVRFHAMQSIVVFLPITVVSFVLGFIPIIGWLLGIVLWIVTVVLWVLLMVKAGTGHRYMLPVAGEIAETQLKRMPSG